MSDLSDASTLPAGRPVVPGDNPVGPDSTDSTDSTEAAAADPDQRLPHRTQVLVVGAGFSGLATVIGLTKAGYRDVVVIDRGQTVGGTWRDNTYPGAACDVPSQLYSFSFALNPEWSSSYSRQPEIERYLQGVTETFGVADHVYGGVEMTGARWDDAAAEWVVTTSSGTVRAKVLALGIGPLCEPRLPDIAGIDTFQGALMHSANWDHDVDLAGKRVAVIGTGASAIQIVPQVSEVAAHLDVYQRTAPWVMPRNDHGYHPLVRLAMRHVPGFQRVMRTAIYWALESRVIGFVKRPAILGKASVIAAGHMKKAVTDPELRRKLTPHYTMGCKRILVSNDYYPAIARDTTELVTDSIREIRPHSIVTADGTERPIDVLVVATGFLVTDNPTAQLVQGRDGQTLAQFWDENGMAAYKGVSVKGFPNMFYLLGPNTGLGHSSMTVIAEAHAAYTVDAVRAMDEFGLDTVEVLPEAYDEYAARMQRELRGTVWTSGNCASWYLDRHGNNTTLWPGFTFVFRSMLQRFDLRSYRSSVAADRAGRHRQEPAPAAGPKETVA